MTEEMKHASQEAPKVIVMSVYIGAVTGFIFPISLCFCIGDIDSTASSITGIARVDIFYNSTTSIVETCFLGSLFIVIIIIANNADIAEGSRVLYTFARDRGLAFSTLFAQAEPSDRWKCTVSFWPNHRLQHSHFHRTEGFCTCCLLTPTADIDTNIQPYKFPPSSALAIPDHRLLRQLRKGALGPLDLGQVQHLAQYRRTLFSCLHVHYL